MSLILKALEESLRDHTLIGVHSDRADLEKFSLGWITALSRTQFCMASVDEFGGPDGFQIERLDDILRVSRNGSYIESIQSIVSSNVAFTRGDFKYEIADIGDALSDLHQKRRVVTLVLEDRSATTGLITEIDESELEIKSFDKVGRYDGNDILRIEDLFRIEFLGRRELVIESVLQHNEHGTA